MIRICIFALLLLFATSVVMAQESAKTHLEITLVKRILAIKCLNLPMKIYLLGPIDSWFIEEKKTSQDGKVTFDLDAAHDLLETGLKDFHNWQDVIHLQQGKTEFLKTTLHKGESVSEDENDDWAFKTLLPEIKIEPIIINTLLTYDPYFSFPLRDKKLSGSHFKLLPCLIDISCNT